MKVIVLVCDPIKRAISEFHHVQRGMSRKDPEHYKEHSIGARDTFDEHVVDAGRGTLNVSRRVFRASLYDVHVERWLAVFPREQVLVVEKEDLMFTDWKSVLSSVETFLGIGHELEDTITVDDVKGGWCVRGHAFFGRQCKRRRGHEHKPVSDTVMKMMVDQLAPHARVFGDLVGRDFRWF